MPLCHPRRRARRISRSRTVAWPAAARLEMADQRDNQARRVASLLRSHSPQRMSRPCAGTRSRKASRSPAISTQSKRSKSARDSRAIWWVSTCGKENACARDRCWRASNRPSRKAERRAPKPIASPRRRIWQRHNGTSSRRRSCSRRGRSPNGITKLPSRPSPQREPASRPRKRTCGRPARRSVILGCWRRRTASSRRSSSTTASISREALRSSPSFAATCSSSRPPCRLDKRMAFASGRRCTSPRTAVRSTGSSPG